MRVTEVFTDDSQRELRMHGTANFPFEFYDDDIHSYIQHYIECHWHKEVEWAVVDQGIVDCRVGSEQITLHEGDGIFINSRIIHGFQSEHGALMPNILFVPEFLSPDTSAVYLEYVLPVLRSRRTCFVLHKANEKERGLLDILNQLFHLAKSSPLPKLDIQIAACTLWRNFITHTDGLWDGEHNKQDMLLSARIRTMLQFIADHYGEKISLCDIASSANISKSEALRCFHQAIQTTPVKYLIDYRLHRAKERLLSTNDSITQIAAQVGMDNTSYFIRLFTQKFTMTPRIFRLRSQNGPSA